MQKSRPERQFVAAEWLGVGKQYILKELPEIVTDAKAALLEIPGSFWVAYVPKDEMVVNDFIKTTLPVQSAELWPVKATDCYSPNFPSGNTANAVAAANTVALSVLKKRDTTFSREKYKLPNRSLLVQARVSKLRPLILGTYGFIFIEGPDKKSVGSIKIGQVKALYSKSGGKGGKYSSVTEKSNIGAVSYLVVQIFEPVAGGINEIKFQPKTDRMSLLQTNEFALLPPFCFLTMLNAAPTLSKSEPAGFTISEADCTVFEDWTELDSLSQMTQAMREFTKRKSGKVLDVIDEE